MGVWVGGGAGVDDSVGDGECAGYQSGDVESGEEFEDGIACRRDSIRLRRIESRIIVVATLRVATTQKIMTMFTNYLKIAWRNLKKNRIYSFINIFGLTVGLAAFLLIALYIFDELTYDAFHKNANSIYRVIEHKTSAAGKESNVVSIAYNISQRARKDFPEVEQATTFSMLGRSNMSNEENTNVFYESYFLADANFFKVFSFPVVQGDVYTALTAPYSIVMTEEAAVKMFGTKEAVGKTLRTDRDTIPSNHPGVEWIAKRAHIAAEIHAGYLHGLLTRLRDAEDLCSSFVQ